MAFVKRYKKVPAMTHNRFDPITLEVLWNRLVSIVNEQAAALMHASFTTVVREAGDLSAGVFDEQGNMLAQAVTGTPGHINTMATCVRHFLREYPLQSLHEGDTLITNDPWLASGHYHDFTVVTPVFRRGRAVGLFANTCHVMDIGGRLFGADAGSVYEEGLAIPIMKLVDRGVLNSDLIKIIRANVRVPDWVVGDLHAMVAGNEVGGAKLLEMMEDCALENLNDLSAAIIERSEASMREAIGRLPDGTYRHQIDMDGFDEPIVVKLAVTIEGEHMTADYTGTSPQSSRGINVVYSYCHAYTTYPIKCSVSPEVPNNEGSFRPVTVIAPEGCILNCQRPVAVGARHILGHFLSAAVFGALSHVLPEHVIAEGSQGLWNTQFDGLDERGDPFCYVFFSAGGYRGAAQQGRALCHGLPQRHTRRARRGGGERPRPSSWVAASSSATAAAPGVFAEAWASAWFSACAAATRPSTRPCTTASTLPPRALPGGCPAPRGASTWTAAPSLTPRPSISSRPTRR